MDSTILGDPTFQLFALSLILLTLVITALAVVLATRIIVALTRFIRTLRLPKSPPEDHPRHGQQDTVSPPAAETGSVAPQTGDPFRQQPAHHAARSPRQGRGKTGRRNTDAAPLPDQPAQHTAQHTAQPDRPAPAPAPSNCPVCTGDGDTAGTPCAQHAWLSRIIQEIENGTRSDWKRQGMRHEAMQSTRAAVPAWLSIRHLWRYF